MMEEKIKQLKTLLAEVFDLQKADYVLSWDHQVNMPSGGAKARGEQRATLRRLAHAKLVSPEVGRLLDDLKTYAEEIDPDSDDARLIKVSTREYERNAKVPPEYTAELYRTTTVAHHAWEEARAEDDFKKFQPHLEKIVELAHRYVEYFAPYEHVYDPLLDRFEPGMKTVEVKAIFDALRPQQVELIQAIAEQPQVDDSFLHLTYDRKQQWDFGAEVITKYGYDWKRGRQDESAHPFTTSFSVDDVRITTRFDTNYLGTALFGTLHECGHALYGQGISPALDRTILADGASYGVHESQSRMYENLVGRSRPFWEHFYPRLQEYFPNQLKSVGLDTFYKGINKVEPSLIRVEADEATYNLHIMLRLELEMAIMEGNLEIKDLPDAWNARVEEYLGLTPPNDADGVLQDVHWSSGYFGYFSTYALGNLISVQLWERLNEDLPDLREQIRRGEFAELLDWLRTNIHQHGKKYSPQELVERVTGSKIDSVPYVRYLKTKYEEIYGL
ncbi:MAG: carboxypeptidase M32 [Anaerolineales bacterium]|jgi:carboxypeptidase Taq